MALNLYYRLDGKNPPIPSSDIVLGVPLSMLQIDANWKSVANAIISIDETLVSHNESIEDKAPKNNPSFSGYVTFPTSSDDYSDNVPVGSVYYNTTTNTLLVKTENGWVGLGTNNDLAFYLPKAGGDLYGKLEAVDAVFRGVLETYSPDYDPDSEEELEPVLERVATAEWVEKVIEKHIVERFGEISKEPVGDECYNVFVNDPNGIIYAAKLMGDIDMGVMTAENKSLLA